LKAVFRGSLYCIQSVTIIGANSLPSAAFLKPLDALLGGAVVEGLGHGKEKCRKSECHSSGIGLMYESAFLLDVL